MGSDQVDDDDEEEKLVQMVHDFIESETSTTPTSNPSSQTITFHHPPHITTLQGIVGSVTKAEMEIYETVLIHLKYVTKMGNESSNSSTCVKRRLMMLLRMVGYDASLCKSSWDATFRRLGGNYDYIDVMVEDDEISGRNSKSLDKRLIVDIDFKSQFELARPTSTYTLFFNTLPSIFVGSEEKICKIISLLCTAAKESLKERGLHIPPWRKASYMQSKWLSTCCQKISTICIEEEVKRVYDDHDICESSETSSWNPPKVEPKRRDMQGHDGSHGSCLSSQFSGLSISSF